MVVIIEGLMMRLVVMTEEMIMSTSSSSKGSRHPPTARHILYPTLRRHSHSANKPPGIIRCPNIYPAQSQSMMDYSSHPYTYSTTVLHSSKTGYHEQKYECFNWEKWIPWMPPLNMLSFSPPSANNAPMSPSNLPNVPLEEKSLAFSWTTISSFWSQIFLPEYWKDSQNNPTNCSQTTK